MAGDGVVLTDLHDDGGPPSSGAPEPHPVVSSGGLATRRDVPNDEETKKEPDDTPANVIATTEDGEHPSLSHALAKSVSTGGAVQEPPEHQDVEDLGWHDAKDDIENPLVGGLPNDELWVLVRRFNKVRSMSSSLGALTDRLPANVPCQRTSAPAARGVGSQHCR